MPLTRYQIRNEYGLADTKLYEAANRDDHESLLEGIAMAGLVGVLRQLGDLAEFAAEIFHCLHEELMTTAARGHGVMIRLQQLEAEFPLVEKSVLSQTDHSLLFSGPGLDWHPYLQTEGNLITRGDLPRCIMDSYEECRGPPRLFLLDKFDVAGTGSCFKRYSDPSLFKAQSVSELPTSNIRIVKKYQKVKKKGSRGMDEETPEAGLISHAKLHQLFSREHVEIRNRDPQFQVKLKRRQLNGSPINSSSGRSYMEKLVKSPPPDHETAPRSHSKLSFHTLKNYNASETGELDKLCQAIVTEVKVSNVQEVLATTSTVNSNSGNTGQDLEMEPQHIADAGVEIPFTPRKSTNKEKPLTNQEVEPDICLEVGHSLELTSTGNTYTDIPVYMGTKKTETESADEPSDVGHLGVGEHHTYLDAHESETKVLAWFFDILHHSLEEEESKSLHADFSSSSPESKLSNTEGSAGTEDLSFVQPSVSKTSADMGTPELEETLLNLSAYENPQNLIRDTQSYLQLGSEKLKADEFGMNPPETSSVPELGRGAMLSTPPEAHEEYLSELPQAPSEAEETRAAVLLTNYTDDCNIENVFGMETESVVSFSVLMDDQFTSLLDQEMEILKPESVSSEVDVSLLVTESNSKETPMALDLDKVLPTQDLGVANGFEDLSLVSIAHDETISEDDETNSESRYSMNTKMFDLISPSGNPDLAKRPSDSEQEDRQTVSMVSDDSDCKGMISKDNTDTLSCEASFSSDADHNKAGLSDIALETLQTMHETGLRISDLSDSICYQQTNRLVTQEHHSSEYCPWSRDQGKDSPLGNVPIDPITTSAESLPSHATAHDVSVDLHGLSSVKPAMVGSDGSLESDTDSSSHTSHLQNSGHALPSGFTELEALHSADKKSSTSLDDHSMDHADEENFLDIFSEAAPHCSVSLYEETQARPFDTPPLPPLPPTQWWIGKLIDLIKMSGEPFPSVVSLEDSGNSSARIHVEEYTLKAASNNEDTMVAKTRNANKELFPSFPAGGKFNVSSVHAGEKDTPNGSIRMSEALFSSVASLAVGESHNIHVHANEATLQAVGSETPEIEHFGESSRGNVDEKSEIAQHGPKGAAKTLDAFKPSQTFQGLNLNENPLTENLMGHETSFGSIVVTIDRSMLRKASERPRPPLGPRMNEQDSLLEIIRSKSFNLRPANAMLRPNVQGVPVTNLRIAAILEKADSLRQAMAGSDDDNDSDSWSDA
ncbi:PREDICTED: protein SCAR4 isoform X2 [Tarenaya hassleriana]|uniref:protein SCAR4 isoform X2 n=1 Tax=Tarenaya hassleriana TaxID=28532 RepID=UPI00053C234C|nr:PREDICTED: protein SCAR4 isoform X2 [Tarenaya hassleriana]